MTPSSQGLEHPANPGPFNSRRTASPDSRPSRALRPPPAQHEVRGRLLRPGAEVLAALGAVDALQADPDRFPFAQDLDRVAVRDADDSPGEGLCGAGG